MQQTQANPQENAWARWTRTLIGGLRFRPARRLRLGETLNLGERRTVSIVECDGQSFLIGSTNASIVLLAQLAPGQHAAERWLGPIQGAGQ